MTFEPYYDSYAAGIDLAGGVRRTVPLSYPDLTFDPEQLAAAFSERTRVVLLNSPHNPLGKVFTRAELEVVADLARRHDAWVISDEVYEHLTFDVPHVPIATLPGMAERTLTIGSAGKFFSVTGWKVGWVTGPAALVRAARVVKQYLTFTTASPLQHAVAHALDLGAQVLTDLTDSLQERRDLLVAGLADAGLDVRPSDGTYFVVADAAPLGVPDALQWCLDLPAAAGSRPCRSRSSATTPSACRPSCASPSASRCRSSRRPAAVSRPSPADPQSSAGRRPRPQV